MNTKILLLEDDNTLSDTIVEFLEEKQFDVTPAYDGEEASDIIYEKQFDLLLLDVNVPLLNGFELLKQKRKDGLKTPAIYITSLDSMDSLESGYDSGCDDYIRKPFALKELHLRMQTLLKREFMHTSNARISIDKTIEYDTETNILFVEGKEYSLSTKEAQLLKLFLQRKGEVIAHEVIYETLWEFEETASESALRTYIKNLRKIIGKEKIVSIKKQGYRFSE